MSLEEDARQALSAEQERARQRELVRRHTAEQRTEAGRLALAMVDERARELVALFQRHRVETVIFMRSGTASGEFAGWIVAPCREGDAGGQGDIVVAPTAGLALTPDGSIWNYLIGAGHSQRLRGTVSYGRVATPVGRPWAPNNWQIQRWLRYGSSILEAAKWLVGGSYSNGDAFSPTEQQLRSDRKLRSEAERVRRDYEGRKRMS